MALDEVLGVSRVRSTGVAGVLYLDGDDFPGCFEEEVHLRAVDRPPEAQPVAAAEDSDPRHQLAGHPVLQQMTSLGGQDSSVQGNA